MNVVVVMFVLVVVALMSVFVLVFEFLVLVFVLVVLLVSQKHMRGPVSVTMATSSSVNLFNEVRGQGKRSKGPRGGGAA